MTDALFLVKNARNLQPDWISEELGIPRRPDPFHGTGGQSLLSPTAPSPKDQPLGCVRIPRRGGGGGGGRGHGAREPSGGVNLPPEGQAIGDGDPALPPGTHSPMTRRWERPLSPNRPCWERSLLPLCFPNSQKRGYLGSGRCALPRERSWHPADVSSGVYPLLSYKRGILTPAPPLPSDQDPKITISSWPVNH